ncbi:TPA: hypothetical protein N2D16_002749 [Clostridium botulinum]|nr:hypothetical protein [Clostridium botulinum]HCL4455128.1 hypothetical protein [Clostridium botulinum]
MGYFHFINSANQEIVIRAKDTDDAWISLLITHNREYNKDLDILQIKDLYSIYIK